MKIGGKKGEGERSRCEDSQCKYKRVRLRLIKGDDVSPDASPSGVTLNHFTPSSSPLNFTRVSTLACYPKPPLVSCHWFNCHWVGNCQTKKTETSVLGARISDYNLFTRAPESTSCFTSLPDFARSKL